MPADITKQGIGGLKGLKGLNSAMSEEELLYRQMADMDRKRVATGRVSPSYVDYNPKPYGYDTPMGQWGTSKYDDPILNNPQTAGEQQDTRYENQAWYDVLGNGLGKMLGKAGTTFISSLVGLPYGLVEAAREGDPSKLWDNSVTQGLASIDDWFEKNMTNYQSRAQQESPYFRFGDMNWWADNVIANAGFTIGAAASMAVGGGALGALGRTFNLVNEVGKTTKGAATFLSALFSATGEGMVEAKQGVDERNKLAFQELDDSLAPEKQALDLELASINEEFARNKGLSVIQGADGKLVDPAYITYKQRMDELNKKRDAFNAKKELGRQQIEEEGRSMGNKILFGNQVLLTLGNMIQFSKGIMKSFDNARHVAESTAKAVKPALVGAKKTAEGYKVFGKRLGQTAAIVKNPLTEGLEEMNQQFIQSTAGFMYEKKDPNDYWQHRLSPEGFKDVAEGTYTFGEALGKGFKDSYGTAGQWEQFLVGAMMGATGIYTPTKIFNQDKTKSWIDPRRYGSWEGGIASDWNDFKEQYGKYSENIDDLNRVVQSQEFPARLQSFVAHTVLQDEKEKSADDNDKKAWKDADDKQFIHDVQAFARAGKLGDLRAMYREIASNLSDENIEKLVENTTKEVSSEDIKKESDKHYDDLIRQKQETIRGIEKTQAEIMDSASPDGTIWEDLKDTYDSLETQKKELEAEIKKHQEDKENAPIAKKFIGPYVDEKGNRTKTNDQIRDEVSHNSEELERKLDSYLESIKVVQEDTKGVLSKDQEDNLAYLHNMGKESLNRADKIIANNRSKMPKKFLMKTNKTPEQLAKEYATSDLSFQRDENTKKGYVEVDTTKMDDRSFRNFIVRTLMMGDNIGLDLSETAEEKAAREKEEKGLSEEEKKKKTAERLGKKMKEAEEKRKKSILEQRELLGNALGEAFEEDFKKNGGDAKSSSFNTALDKFFQDIVDAAKLVDQYDAYDRTLMEYMANPSKVDAAKKKETKKAADKKEKDDIEKMNVKDFMEKPDADLIRMKRGGKRGKHGKEKEINTALGLKHAVREVERNLDIDLKAGNIDKQTADDVKHLLSEQQRRFLDDSDKTESESAAAAVSAFLDTESEGMQDPSIFADSDTLAAIESGLIDEESLDERLDKARDYINKAKEAALKKIEKLERDIDMGKYLEAINEEERKSADTVEKVIDAEQLEKTEKENPIPKRKSKTSDESEPMPSVVVKLPKKAEVEQQEKSNSGGIEENLKRDMEEGTQGKVQKAATTPTVVNSEVLTLSTPKEEGVEYGEPFNLRKTKGGRTTGYVTRTYQTKEGYRVTETVGLGENGITVSNYTYVPGLPKGYKISGINADYFKDNPGLELVGTHKLTEHGHTSVLDYTEESGKQVFREQDAVVEVVVKNEEGAYFIVTLPLVRTDNSVDTAQDMRAYGERRNLRTGKPTSTTPSSSKEASSNWHPWKSTTREVGYHTNKPYVAPAEDPNAEKKQKRHDAVRKFLEKSGAFTRLRNGEIKAGDTIGFKVFQDVNDEAEDFVIFLTDKDGKVLGDLQSSDPQIDNSALNVSNKDLYKKIREEWEDATDEERKAGMLSKYTSKAEDVLVGKVLYQNERNTVASLSQKDGVKPKFAIWTRAGLLHTGRDKNLHALVNGIITPLTHTPGQPYVLVETPYAKNGEAGYKYYAVPIKTMTVGEAIQSSKEGTIFEDVLVNLLSKIKDGTIKDAHAAQLLESLLAVANVHVNLEAGSDTKKALGIRIKTWERRENTAKEEVVHTIFEGNREDIDIDKIIEALSQFQINVSASFINGNYNEYGNPLTVNGKAVDYNEMIAEVSHTNAASLNTVNNWITVVPLEEGKDGNLKEAKASESKIEWNADMGKEEGRSTPDGKTHFIIDTNTWQIFEAVKENGQYKKVIKNGDSEEITRESSHSKAIKDAAKKVMAQTFGEFYGRDSQTPFAFMFGGEAYVYDPVSDTFATSRESKYNTKHSREKLENGERLTPEEQYHLLLSAIHESMANEEDMRQLREKEEELRRRKEKKEGDSFPMEIPVSRTFKKGKIGNGKYIVTRDADGFIHFNYEGQSQTRMRLDESALKEMGLSVEDVLGNPEDWGSIDSYNKTKKELQEDGMYINQVTIRPNGDVNVVLEGIAPEGKVAETIARKLFPQVYEVLDKETKNTPKKVTPENLHEHVQISSTSLEGGGEHVIFNTSEWSKNAVPIKENGWGEQDGHVYYTRNFVPETGRNVVTVWFKESPSQAVREQIELFVDFSHRLLGKVPLNSPNTLARILNGEKVFEEGKGPEETGIGEQPAGENNPPAPKVDHTKEVEATLKQMREDSKKYKLVRWDEEKKEYVEDSRRGEYYADEQGTVYARVSNVNEADVDIVNTNKEAGFTGHSPAFIPSTGAGNAVDTFVRSLFELNGNNDPLYGVDFNNKEEYEAAVEVAKEIYKSIKVPNISEKEGVNLILDLHRMLHAINAAETVGEWEVDSSGIVADGMVSFDNETSVHVAGTIDLLLYNKKKGEYVIVDMKTHKANIWDDGGNLKTDKRTNATLTHWIAQQTMYKKFLEKKYGIKISGIKIMPFRVNYSTNFAETMYEVGDDGVLRDNGHVVDVSPKYDGRLIELNPKENPTYGIANLPESVKRLLPKLNPINREPEKLGKPIEKNLIELRDSLPKGRKLKDFLTEEAAKDKTIVELADIVDDNKDSDKPVLMTMASQTLLWKSINREAVEKAKQEALAAEHGVNIVIPVEGEESLDDQVKNFGEGSEILEKLSDESKRKVLAGGEALKLFNEMRNEGESYEDIDAEIKDLPDVVRDKKATGKPYEVLDLQKELRWLRKVLPQFSKERHLQIIKGLIKCSDGSEDFGRLMGSVIQIGTQAARGTTYHEAFHAVVQFLLTDEEIEKLWKAGVRKYGELDPVAMEERLADDFEAYTRGLEEEGVIKRFFRELWEMIKALLGNTGFMTALYRDINRGVFASREFRSDRNNVFADNVSERREFTKNYAFLTNEERSRLDEAGVNPEIYDRLNKEDKEYILHCLV